MILSNQWRQVGTDAAAREQFTCQRLATNNVMESGTICGVDIPGLPEKNLAPLHGTKSVVHQNREVLDIFGLLYVTGSLSTLERQSAR